MKFKPMDKALPGSGAGGHLEIKILRTLILIPLKRQGFITVLCTDDPFPKTYIIKITFRIELR